jgi:uncharacterized protein (DUF1015 family)
MTTIKSFKALLYNPAKITDFARVVCPPYDVISDTELETLYNRDNYNFVRILLAKSMRTASGKLLNRYTNAKLTFNKWLKDQILISEDKEGIYFYLQDFPFKGERRSRLGFIALMRLKDKGSSTVYPHELTYQQAKDDRYAMLKAVKANLSPIFTLFSDSQRQVERIFDNYLVKEQPLMSLVTDDGILHKVWRLGDKKLMARLQLYMKDKDIFIADGHHRYEVACEFRNALLRRFKNKAAAKNAPFNYIMTYFIDINSHGLTVLPIHRLVRNIPQDWLERLKELFNIEKARDRLELFLLMTKATNTEHAFGFYIDKRFFLLRLKNVHNLQTYLEGDSKEYNDLDVVVLNKLIFKKLFGLNQADITYIKEEERAIEAVDKLNWQAAFFLCPTKLEQVKTIALNNEKMPQKSTFFYPKLLSGLLINKF